MPLARIRRAQSLHLLSSYGMHCLVKKKYLCILTLPTCSCVYRNGLLACDLFSGVFNMSAYIECS